jgi:hypothetical protein
MNDFLNSELGRWLLRVLVIVVASAVKAGYIPLPLDVIGDIDTSNLLLGSAALIPSSKREPKLRL